MIEKAKKTLGILFISAMLSCYTYGKENKKQSVSKTIIENTFYGIGTGFLLGALTFLVDNSATSSRDFFSYTAMGGLIGAGVGGILFTSIDLWVSGYFSTNQSLSKNKQKSPYNYALKKARKSSNYLVGLRFSLNLY